MHGAALYQQTGLQMDCEWEAGLCTETQQRLYSEFTPQSKKKYNKS